MTIRRATSLMSPSLIGMSLSGPELMDTDSPVPTFIHLKPSRMSLATCIDLKYSRTVSHIGYSLRSKRSISVSSSSSVSERSISNVQTRPSLLKDASSVSVS